MDLALLGFKATGQDCWQYNAKGLTITVHLKTTGRWVATVNGTGWDGTSAQEAMSTVLKKNIQQRMMLIQRTTMDPEPTTPGRARSLSGPPCATSSLTSTLSLPSGSGMREKTVRRLIKRGDLPAFQLGERGQLRIDENELHRYVESQRVRRETLFIAPSEAESEG